MQWLAGDGVPLRNDRGIDLNDLDIWRYKWGLHGGEVQRCFLSCGGLCRSAMEGKWRLSIVGFKGNCFPLLKGEIMHIDYFYSADL